MNDAGRHASPGQIRWRVARSVVGDDSLYLGNAESGEFYPGESVGGGMQIHIPGPNSACLAVFVSASAEQVVRGQFGAFGRLFTE
jgi:hypothetical protein